VKQPGSELTERLRKLGIGCLAASCLALTACGEKDITVVEAEPVPPGPAATTVIDHFADRTGVELASVAHDSEVVGFPGDAIDARLEGASQLLIPSTSDSEEDAETSADEQFGSFVINVVGDDAAYDVLLSDASGEPLPAEGRGIHWEQITAEDVEGQPLPEPWLAHKRYGDVVLTWRSEEMATGPRWEELDRVLTGLPNATTGPVSAPEEGPSGDTR
jgi:hypothetical protein